jgi:hypothetical protein
MKKLLCPITCLIASSLAADQPQPPQEIIPVAQQCSPEIFKPQGVTYGIYGELLYLQPNGSNLYYGVEADGLDPDIAVPAVSPNWKVLEIDPNYHLGFEVGISFFFNKHNLDLDLNWERLHGHDKDSFTAPAANGFMVGPFFDIGPNSNNYKVARGKAATKFDQVNLTFGKELCFFKNFYTEFYGGASFLYLKHSLASSYANAAESIARSVKSSSTFIGAGPQIGIDYRYRIVEHFFFTGNSVFSLFMGRLKNHNHFKSFTPELTTLGIPQPNKQATTVPNRTQLIPGFEQKLGFSYLATWKKIRAIFEIGYQCQIYLNAVQTVDMTAPQVLPAGAIFTPQVGVFAVGFERTLSNFILTGLYAKVGLEF